MDNENPLPQIHAPNSNVLGPSSWLDLIKKQWLIHIDEKRPYSWWHFMGKNHSYPIWNNDLRIDWWQSPIRLVESSKNRIAFASARAPSAPLPWWDLWCAHLQNMVAWDHARCDIHPRRKNLVATFVVIHGHITKKRLELNQHMNWYPLVNVYITMENHNF